jgi:hypothetical protein
MMENREFGGYALFSVFIGRGQTTLEKGFDEERLHHR